MRVRKDARIEPPRDKVQEDAQVKRQGHSQQVTWTFCQEETKDEPSEVWEEENTWKNGSDSFGMSIYSQQVRTVALVPNAKKNYL